MDIINEELLKQANLELPFYEQSEYYFEKTVEMVVQGKVDAELSELLRSVEKPESSYKSGYFNKLKELDEKLFSGELTDPQFIAILKLLFVERHVSAHAEDNKENNTIGKALSDFISDKYDSGVHFFEEILQNIDDSIGRAKKADAGSSGEIYIQWKGTKITFKYPDRGFSFYDVMAITSLGSSSKKGNLDEASIGEKGIGFKSVFAVAKNVHINSRFFSFDISFDGENNTSVLQPSRISAEKTGGKFTELTISFRDEDKCGGFKDALRDWLFTNKKDDYLNYSPFLFLKHVTCVHYSDATGEQQEISITKTSFGKKLPCVVEIGKAKYLLFTHNLYFNAELIESRWQGATNGDENATTKRPIEIAFPITDTVQYGKKGLFYSYLPTTMDIDFPVYINVDVHLKSSRGKITENDFSENSKWNDRVRNRLTNALKSAYLRVTKLYRNYKEDNQLSKCVKEVAEKLYIYFCHDQKTGHFFSGKLQEFLNKIKKEAIYLNVNKEFVTSDTIIKPNFGSGDPDDPEKVKVWDYFTKFCLKKSLPNSEKQYSFNYEWYRNTPAKNYIRWHELLNLYGGVKHFYYYKSPLPPEEKIAINLTPEEKIEIILFILDKSITIYDPCTKYYTWEILFIESNESTDGFVITSKQNAENEGKVVFFRGEKCANVNDEFSLYVSEKPFTKEQYAEYKKTLTRNNFICEKSWTSHLNNQLKTLASAEDKSTVYDIVKKTFVFFKILKIQGENSFEVDTSVKKLFSGYVVKYPDFTEALCNKSEGEREYLNSIYLEVAGDSEKKYGKEVFDTAKCGVSPEDKPLLLEYLLKLGVKQSPENVDGSFDVLTLAVMPGYSNMSSSCVNEKEGIWDFTFTGDGKTALAKYLMKAAGELNIGKKCFEDKGLDFDKFIFLNPDTVRKFLSEAEENNKYFSSKPIKLDSGNYHFVSADWHYNFKRYFKNEDPNAIINGIYYGNDFLLRIRWLQIWNKVLGCDYKWIYKIVHLTLPEFLSCHEYFKIQEVDGLFEKGYQIPNLNYYPQIPNLDELISYIRGEFDEECAKEFENNLNKYIMYDKSDIEYAVPLNKSEYPNLQNCSYKAIICVRTNSTTKKTDYICRILMLIDNLNRLTDLQRNEIRDILGEMSDRTVSVERLRSTEEGWRKAVFRTPEKEAEYDALLEKAINILPSVYQKSGVLTPDLKRTLCEPYKGFAGYGYQCPICGSISDISSLTGLNLIKRLKNGDSHLRIPLIACLNCANMIESSSRVEIRGLNGEPLAQALEHFTKVCWCADNSHPRNAAMLKTMRLLFEVEGCDVFQRDIKLSFLHFALFIKLGKNQTAAEDKTADFQTE